MPFGILEPVGSVRPAGTVFLEEANTLILSPCPSSSPDDPLNWSRWRKELAFVTILLGSSVCGVIGPLLVPAFEIIAEDLGVVLSQVLLLNGGLILALGLSTCICSALAQVYGSRLVFVATTALLIGSCCWAASSLSYGSLLAARVFQGLGMGGWWGLAGTRTLTELYFVHERGRRVGMWNMAVIVSTNLAPVVSSRVIVQLSWRWAFWLCAIAFNFVLLLTIMCFPETSWHREEETEPVETTSTIEKVPHSLNALEKKLNTTHISPPDESAGTITSIDPATWKKIMGIQHVRMGSLPQLGREICSPFTLAWYPANVWASLVWMVTFTWIIVEGGVATQIWGAAPYSMTPSAVGNLVGIAPLIGSLLGCLVGGGMSDWIARTMTRRNAGVYEPEYRLTLMLPSTILMAIGSFGLGESVESGKGALVDGVFLALINAAVGLGCTCVVAYTNDTAGERAGEAFGLAMLVKSAYAFGLTFVLNGYYSNNGPRVFFDTWAALTLGLMLFTIPLYIWGKRLRAWVESRVSPPLHE